MKLATDGTSLIVSLRDKNVIRWIDPATGAVTRSITVSAPGSIAAGANGILYAVGGGNSVISIGTSAVSYIVTGLTAARALAYDSTNSKILVFNGGTEQRIKCYDLTGTLVKNYGRLGGRQQGAYVATDFLDVVDLAEDGAGGFYAVESFNLRRVVRINSAGGVVREWPGSGPFYTVASADPSNPGQVWWNASQDTMVMANLDAAAGTWNIAETYTMPWSGFGDGLFPAVDAFPVWRAKRIGSQNFLFHENPPALLRADATNRKLVPVALATTKKKQAAPLMAAIAAQGLTYDSQQTDAFTWSDANGDGVMDPTEFKFSDVGAATTATGFDANLNIYIGTQSAPNYTWTGSRWLQYDFQKSVYSKLTNTGTASVPKWDWSQLTRSAAKLPSQIPMPGASYVGSKALRVDPSGGVSILLEGEGESGSDRHGASWPEGQYGTAFIVRALGNNTMWALSKHTSPGANPATVLRSPVYFPGAVKGCLIVSDRNSFGATVWTEDGLFAGSFLDRHVNDLPAWCYDPQGRGGNFILAADDWECGGSAHELSDGNVMWYPRGVGRVMAMKVRGWDNWYRASGTLALASPQPASPLAGTGLTGTYYSSTDFSGSAVATQTDPYLWFRNGGGDSRAKDWANGPVAAVAANQAFSTRWTGSIVVPLSEDYWFSIYNKTSSTSFVSTQTWVDGAAFARVWLNGVLIIDRSAGATAGGASAAGGFRLEAGRSYDITVEYSFPGGSAPEFSLNWASNSKGWERIPPQNLYPPQDLGLPSVQVSTSLTSFIEGGAPPYPKVRFTRNVASPSALKVLFAIAGTVEPGTYVPLGGAAYIQENQLFGEVELAPYNNFTIQGTRFMTFALAPNADYKGDNTKGSATITLFDDDNVVTNGLVAYYPLDESEGMVVHDRVGSKDGTISDRATYPIPTPRWLPTGGAVAGALEFFEQGNKVTLPDPQLSGDFSLTWQQRTTNTGTNLMSVPANIYLVDGRPTANFGGWGLSNTTGNRINDGAWHHLAFVWNQATHWQQLFVDGTLYAESWGPANGALNTGAISLGEGNYGLSLGDALKFSGTFDEIRLYNRMLSTSELGTLSALRQSTLPANTTVNSGFETPVLSGGSGAYVYNPTGSNWSFVSNSGVQRNGSAWSAANAPEGSQTAFLQGAPSGLGSMSQIVNFSAGTYNMTFQAAQRPGQSQPIQVKVDGVNVGSTITPTSSSFALYSSAAFTVTDGNHTISLAATDATSDKTSFVDDVQIVVSAPAMLVSGSGTLADGSGVYDYGTVNVNATLDHTFTITNAGTARLTLTGSPYAVMSGTNTADFSVTVQSAATVAAGSTATFTVRFKPSGAGTRTATISIASNDAATSPYTFNVTGSGLAAPAAPSTLAATRPATSTRQINLTWKDNSGNESGFKIERATNSTFTTNLVQVVTTAANAISYSNTGLAANTRYYYRVRATNAAGNSAYSNVVNALTGP